MKKNELSIKWVAALRSGRYKQGTGGLCNSLDEGETLQYCCLGVLCEVSGGLSDRIHVENQDFTGKIYYNYTEHTNNALTPSPLIVAIDMSDDEEKILADKNDRGVPFSEIADYIESVWCE